MWSHRVQFSWVGDSVKWFPYTATLHQSQDWYLCFQFQNSLCHFSTFKGFKTKIIHFLLISNSFLWVCCCTYWQGWSRVPLCKGDQASGVPETALADVCCPSIITKSAFFSLSKLSGCGQYILQLLQLLPICWIWKAVNNTRVEILDYDCKELQCLLC